MGASRLGSAGVLFRGLGSADAVPAAAAVRVFVTVDVVAATDAGTRVEIAQPTPEQRRGSAVAIGITALAGSVVARGSIQRAAEDAVALVACKTAQLRLTEGALWTAVFVVEALHALVAVALAEGSALRAMRSVQAFDADAFRFKADMAFWAVIVFEALRAAMKPQVADEFWAMRVAQALHANTGLRIAQRFGGRAFATEAGICRRRVGGRCVGNRCVCGRCVGNRCVCGRCVFWGASAVSLRAPSSVGIGHAFAAVLLLWGSFAGPAADLMVWGFQAVDRHEVGRAGNQEKSTQEVHAKVGHGRSPFASWVSAKRIPT